MINVVIYDQYSNVYAEDGETLLHASSGTTFLAGQYNTQEEAVVAVTGFYDQAKNLGTYEDKLVILEKGYAELKIDFEDGRKLNRVIYIP